MSTIRKWLQEHEGKFSTKKEYVEACSKELGVREDSVYKKIAAIWPTKKSVPKSQEEMNKDLIPPEQFLADVDDVKKILDFLNDTVKDSYIEDDKLRRKFEISNARWREVVKLSVFEDRSLTYDCGGGKKKTVWSSKEGIEIAKNTISMARYEL